MNKVIWKRFPRFRTKNCMMDKSHSGRNICKDGGPTKGPFFYRMLYERQRVPDNVFKNAKMKYNKRNVNTIQ